MPIWNWNLPSFTAGSVPFGAASGVLTQNNANLFWDDVNKRMGIRTVSPTDVFEVFKSAGALAFRVNATSGIIEIGPQDTNLEGGEIRLVPTGAVGDTRDCRLDNFSDRWRVHGDGISQLIVDMSTNVGRATTPGADLAQDLGTITNRWRQYFGNLVIPTTSQTANYTATLADGVIFMDATGAARTVTLPAAGSSTLGRIFYVYKIDASANAVTVAGAGTDTVVGQASATIQWQLLFVMGQTATQWISRRN